MKTTLRSVCSTRAAWAPLWVALSLGWGCAKSGDSRSFASPPPAEASEAAAEDALDAALDPARELAALEQELRGYETRLASLQRPPAREPAVVPMSEAAPPRSAPVGGATARDAAELDAESSSRKRKRPSKSAGRTRKTRETKRPTKPAKIQDVMETDDLFGEGTSAYQPNQDIPRIGDPPAEDATADAGEGTPAREEGPAARCEEICMVAAAVCDLEVRICDLAASHPGEAAYEDLCERARGDCVAAAEACEACDGTEPVEE